MYISWLNIIDGLDKMLSSEIRICLCLLPELSYILHSLFVSDVLVQGLMTGTYNVVLRDLFSHCAVEPLLEMRVVTADAVVLAILVTVLMLELVSPFLFCDTMDSMSAENCSIAWFKYWMVLSS